MTFGSLFAGIGGFDLGLERAGFECLWQVEVNAWCRRILAKHWPNVPKHDDIRTFQPDRQWSVDLICGGFPCQDLSYAGSGDGIHGARSGLWSEYARVVRLLRPRFVLVENVPAILRRGLNVVVAQLSACGYDCEWALLSASAFGLPHLRRRLFLLAYPTGQRPQERIFSGLPPETRSTIESDWQRVRPRWREPGATDGDRVRLLPADFFYRRDDGYASRVDSIRGLGNAVVPQVVEWIGKRILTVFGDK